MSLRAAILRHRSAQASAPPPSPPPEESWEEAIANLPGGSGPQPETSRKRAATSFLVRRASDPTATHHEDADSPLLPNPFEGLEWWVSPMRLALVHFFEGLKFSRPVKVESVCTGLGAEFFALRALGIPFNPLAASDPKPSAQAWVRHNHTSVPHMYRTMQGQSRRKGCIFHGDLCPARQVRPDVVIGGPPCQPYSDARPGRYSSSRPEAHRLYPTIFEMSPESGGSFLCTLQRLQPLGFVFEEVPGFGKMAHNEIESALDQFTQKVRSLQRADGEGPLFPGVQIIRQDGHPWLDLPRERLYIVGVTEELGGQKAADTILSAMAEVSQLRAVNDPKSPDTLLEQVWTRMRPMDRLRAMEPQESRPLGAKDTGKWKVISIRTRAAFQMSPNSKPWSEYEGRPKEFKGIAMTERTRDLVEVAWGSVPPSERSVHGFYCDLSQCVGRKRWGRLRTITSNSLLYSYASDSKISAPQMLGLMGLCPASTDLSCVSESALRDMVGEGMFAPSIALALAAYVANPLGPWWTPESKKLRSGSTGGGSHTS